jgi:hypothetical protein
VSRSRREPTDTHRDADEVGLEEKAEDGRRFSLFASWRSISISRVLEVAEGTLEPRNESSHGISNEWTTLRYCIR